MVFGGEMPSVVGRYEIVLQIARGGMATVYLARSEGHGGFDRYVALKLTAEHLRDDPEFAQHLVEEAKLVAHLRHTNVVPVLDVGEDELGAVFLVMEYVPGDSLGGLFRTAKKSSGFVPPRVGLRVLVDALAGLHAAHEHADEDGNSHKLVHRDFSPQNILVGTDGIARLTDFGIAKASSRAAITTAGTMKGKVSYASPEQARGAALDRRCDVWAAGVIAWEILVGKKLFPSSERTLLDIVKGPPPRIRSVLPDIPVELDQVISEALQVDVDARTPTAQAFGRALAKAARSAGLFAEIEEVAEHVQHAVGPILAERKEKIAEARRTRAMQPSSSDLLVLDEDTAAMPDRPVSFGVESAGATVPLPSLPSLPEIPIATRRLDRVPETSSENLRLMESGATMRDGQMHDGGGGMMGAGGYGNNGDRPSDFSPSGTPSGVATTRGGGGGAAAGGGGFGRSSFQSIVDLKTNLVERATRFTAQKPMIVIGGASAIAVVFLLTAVLILVASGPSESDKAKAAAAARASASASMNAQYGNPPVGPTSTSTTTPTRTSLGEAEPLPAQLSVSANAAISRVRIGKRYVEMEVAAPNVAVELTPEESASILSVSVTANDGRVASATWNPGDTDIALTFGGEVPTAPVAKKPPPPVKPRPPPKRK